MTPLDSNSQTEAQVWSAHHLPNPKASRMLSFSVLAVIAGLVVIVLASTVKDPIRTAGTNLEPKRFQTSAQTGKAMIQAGNAATSFMVASAADHR